MLIRNAIDFSEFSTLSCHDCPSDIPLRRPAHPVEPGAGQLRGLQPRGHGSPQERQLPQLQGVSAGGGARLRLVLLRRSQQPQLRYISCRKYLNLHILSILFLSAKGCVAQGECDVEADFHYEEAVATNESRVEDDKIHINPQKHVLVLRPKISHTIRCARFHNSILSIYLPCFTLHINLAKQIPVSQPKRSTMLWTSTSSSTPQAPWGGSGIN